MRKQTMKKQTMKKKILKEKQKTKNIKRKTKTNFIFFSCVKKKIESDWYLLYKTTNRNGKLCSW